MSVTDAPQPPSAGAGTPPVPARHTSRTPRHAAPGRAMSRRPSPAGAQVPLAHGLRRTEGRVLAGALALAWLLCPVIEPMPSHDVDYPLWQLPIELAAVGSIVAAVVALWRGSRHSARLTLAAGALMAVMTMICPLAGHTPVGWWTWVQTGLSLGVIAVGVALHRVRGDR